MARKYSIVTVSGISLIALTGLCLYLGSRSSQRTPSDVTSKDLIETHRDPASRRVEAPNSKGFLASAKRVGEGGGPSELQSLRSKIEKLSTEEIRNQLSSLDGSKGVADSLLVCVLLSEGLKRDPEEFFGILKGLGGMTLLDGGASPLQALAAKRPDLLREFVEGLNMKTTVGQGVANASWTALAKADPKKALETAQSLGNNELAIACIFCEIGSSGMDGALQEALKLDDPRMKSTAVRAAIMSRQSSDPSGCFEALKSIPAQDSKQALNLLFSTWSRTDWTAAATHFSSLDADQKAELLGHSNLFMDIATAHDPGLVQSTLQNVPLTRDTANLFSRFYGEMDVLSFEDRLAGASSLPPGGLRDEILTKVWSNVKKDDTDGSLQKLSALDPKDRAIAVKALASAAAEDADSRTTLLKGLSNDETVVALSAFTKKIDPSQAPQLLQSALDRIGNPEQASQSLAGSVTDLGKRTGTDGKEKALTWVASLPATFQGPAASGALGGWASSDPQSLATWLNDHHDSEFYKTGVKALIQELQSVDSDAAEQWKKLLPPGP